MSETSIVAKEVEQFAAHAGDWWDPDGSEAMLHKLNPVRLQYIRDQIDQHWQSDETNFRPLDGKSALDVGCGAGLLAEPLARLGAKVTAIDAAPELIAAAQAHAEGSGLAIDYRATALEDLGGAFDLVTSLEVVEHVADPRSFVKALAARLAPGGLLILSTPNRTAWSRLLDDHARRRARPCPARHPRFRQVRHPRRTMRDGPRGRARGNRCRRDRFLAAQGFAPQRRHQPQLSGGGDQRLIGGDTGGEILVDRGDHLRAVADRRRYPFDRARAHVADREHAAATGFVRKAA